MLASTPDGDGLAVGVETVLGVAPCSLVFDSGSTIGSMDEEFVGGDALTSP